MAERLFILSLGRKGGSVIYGTEIVNRFEGAKEVFVSTYCSEKLPAGSQPVKTYRNRWQFALSSVTRLPKLWFYCFRQLRKGNYSAFYVPYFHYWNLPFILLFKWFGKKTVITVHDGIPHTGDGKFLEARLNKACIQHADDLIFLSAFVRDQVNKELGFSAKAHIIPHGLIIPAGMNELPRRYPEKVRLLFLGRLSYYKGIDLLIKALKNIDHPKLEGLTIAGEIQGNLDILIDDQRIRLLPKWHSEAEIAALINTHDLLVLPYREATQSGVVTIGIAAGIPMVVTTTGGLPEQLTAEEAVFVAPDAIELIKGIRELLDDKKRYEQISKRLIEKRKQLSWEVIAGNVEKIFTANPSS